MKSFKQFKEEKEKEKEKEEKPNSGVSLSIRMANAARRLPLDSTEERNKRRRNNISSRYYKS